MRLFNRLIVLIFIVVLLGGITAGAYFIWTQLQSTPTTIAQLPTHTPAPAQPTPAGTPLPIAAGDECIASTANGLQISPSDQRLATRFQNLISLRNRPVSEAQTLDLPDSLGRNLVLIQFVPSATREQKVEYVRSFRGVPLRELTDINTVLAILPRNAGLEVLPTSPLVVRAERDQMAGATQGVFGSGSGPVAAPINDPRYGEQWGLSVMGLPALWPVIPADVREVVVAVLDSGVCLDHPDLQGRLVNGYDFVDFDLNPDDEFGHGCGVAGIIAANANNGLGIAGIAPNARIMPLRVLNSVGLGSYYNIASAILYAVENGADIINLSLAGPNSSAILADAITYATQRGVVIIAATGNQSEARVWFPASHPDVIAVGSIDENLSISAFTNRGPEMALLAPGRNIITTGLGGTYNVETGTSFAAPHVAGAAALAIALNIPLSTSDGIVFLYPPNTITYECRPTGTS